jgi:shikimate 5-dehydrogenase
VLWELRRERAQVTVFARDERRGRETADEFGAGLATLEGARFDGFDLVVNTTPVGTRGALEGETAARAGQLRGARVAFDLVYNPPLTRFLREAREAGCKTVGGLGMLAAQAAAQFQLWTGRAAPVETMRRAAEVRLGG